MEQRFDRGGQRRTKDEPAADAEKSTFQSIVAVAFFSRPEQVRVSICVEKEPPWSKADSMLLTFLLLSSSNLPRRCRRLNSIHLSPHSITSNFLALATSNSLIISLALFAQ